MKVLVGGREVEAHFYVSQMRMTIINKYYMYCLCYINYQKIRYISRIPCRRVITTSRSSICHCFNIDSE